MNITIMRGCSGAGKSTYIRMHFPNAFVCSADSFFMVDGHYQFEGAKLSEAHKACFMKFIEAVIDKVEHIVVDNTNTQAWEMSPYILAGSSFGYEVEIITLIVDPKTAAKRNVHGVRLRDVERHSKNIEKSWIPPWWSNKKIEVPILTELYK